MHKPIDIHWNVPQEFHAVVPAAILRAQFLYPQVQFNFDGQSIHAVGVSNADDGPIARDVAYIVYREQIRCRFQPFRERVLHEVFGS